MTFNELYESIKKKFSEHPEIKLEREKLAIQITDIFDNAFYILWDNGKCLLEPFHYNDYDVCIVASQHDIELLFTEQQYFFIAHNTMNIIGSFVDVMEFQKLLSYVAKDSSYIAEEEVVSQILLKQDDIKKDLEIVMQSLQLLITNILLNNSEKNEIMTSVSQRKKSKSKIKNE